MKDTFLKALAADGAIKENELSETYLHGTYGPLQKQVEESIAKQDVIMAKIQVRIRNLFILYVISKIRYD